MVSGRCFSLGVHQDVSIRQMLFSFGVASCFVLQPMFIFSLSCFYSFSVLVVSTLTVDVSLTDHLTGGVAGISREGDGQRDVVGCRGDADCQGGYTQHAAGVGYRQETAASPRHLHTTPARVTDTCT